MQEFFSLQAFIELLDQTNTYLYTYILVFTLLACGIYFSIRTRFIQFRFLPQVFKILREKSHEEHVSPFGALMVLSALRTGSSDGAR